MASVKCFERFVTPKELQMSTADLLSTQMMTGAWTGYPKSPKILRTKVSSIHVYSAAAYSASAYDFATTLILFEVKAMGPPAKY